MTQREPSAKAEAWPDACFTSADANPHRDALRKKLERGDDFALVEVLSPEAYDQYHPPGAINTPLGPHFDENALQTLRDKNQEIVVYCSDEKCSASPTAYKRLKDLGYRRVYDYEFGKHDWLRSAEQA